VNGIRYLTLPELLQLYEAVMEASDGSPGIADLGLIESALAQPRATFGEGERVILEVASGRCSRQAFTAWLKEHIKPS
jgi:hypothetical protein